MCQELHRISFLVLGLVLLTTSLPAQTEGTYNPPPRTGWAIQELSDTTGDGIPEYAVARWDLVIDPNTQATVQANQVFYLDGVGNTVLWTRVDLTSVIGRVLSRADWNGDGIWELVISTDGVVTPWAPAVPSGVDVVDAQTGATVATFPVPPLTTASGTVVHPIRAIRGADLDGDGLDEVVFSTNVAEFGSCDRVYVISPTLPTMVLASAEYSFGSQLQVTDDLDLDGLRDLVIDVPYHQPTGSLYSVGMIGAWGGLSLAPVWQITGASPANPISLAGELFPDRDLDGFDDLLVRIAGGFEIRSSTTGAFLGALPLAATSLAQANNTIYRVSDRDGDGRDDMVFFGLDLASSAETMVVISSADLREIDVLPLPIAGTSYVNCLANLPDTNGDGRPEIITGTSSSLEPVGGYHRHELRPCLAALADGSPNHDLLKVDGSAWLPSRRCDRTIGQPFTISVDPDPTTGQTTDLILWGLIGVPNAGSAFSVQGGATFLFPPRIAAPSLPWLFCLADSVGFDPAAAFPAFPAPWSIGAPFGLPSAIDITLQGVTISGGNIDITNGVLIQVR
ncbi:MAG: hypothetical protein H6807_13235 [Planctomycetes bacterium]|nr:hypothetical protein [Planctomycetota bacterium]